ncbi:hypothetical protein [Marinivivus vitaminiproducens]|uniref:hypothetical protein n=1 Tax=Marinivivus vitaminiproducens TaxID=3035935 RepID=UPI0027A5DFE6|nr:MaoC family dehydratase [Geminicoccaceae bacterium SCSIO 64248]
MPSIHAKTPFAGTRQVPIRLDDSPAYKGSVHDDAVARRMGFKAALIPGVFVYGHMSRIAVDAWGADWVRQGGMRARFRRPVYNGDVLTIEAGEAALADGALRATLRARNEEGEEVAEGWLGLPEAAPEPPALERCPILAMPESRTAVEAGGLVPGTRIGTHQAVLTEEALRTSLAAFDETHPLYAAHGFAHSGCLVRLAMADTNRNFRFPGAVVFVTVESQHFAPVFPGQRIATSGTVTAVYERNGRHYFDSDEVLIADGGTVAARFLRTSIYA